MCHKFDVARVLRRHLLQSFIHANGCSYQLSSLHKLHRFSRLREDTESALSNRFIVELAAVARVGVFERCLFVAVQVGHVGGVVRSDGGDAF